MKKQIFLLVILHLLIVGCKKEDAEEIPVAGPTPYYLRIPDGFPQPVIPSSNPMTVEGVALGKMLYYDPILSSNGLKCASCHVRTSSFSLPVFVSSTGDQISVPPHVNLAWNPDYNWNGSEPVLDHLCLADFIPGKADTIHLYGWMILPPLLICCE